MLVPPHAHRPGLAVPRRVRWPDDLELVRGLFRDYREWVADHRDPEPASAARVAEGLDLIDSLVAGLPGAYGPPLGDVVLWSDTEGIAACGALRTIEPGVGDLKRVFVRPAYRGPEFGAIFARAMIDRAGELGYRRLRVDTLASMAAAIEFYQGAGFRPIERYWPHPAPGALFFELEIEPAQPGD